MLILSILNLTYHSLLRCLYQQSHAMLTLVHLLQVSALFPVFAVLEGQTQGSYMGAIDAKLAPLTLWATESRIVSLRGMVTRLLALLSMPEGASINTIHTQGSSGNGFFLAAEGCDRHRSQARSH